MEKKIIVAGSTGRTGRLIVNKLLKKGTRTRLLVRDLEAAQALFGDSPEYVIGDVRRYQTLLPAMVGMSTVISAIGTRCPVGKNCPEQVDYQGVANLIHAAQSSQVSRFILISSIAVTHPEHPLNRFGKVLEWKRKGEMVLESSGLTYTIIRPGGLKDTPGGMHPLKFDQGDRMMGMISREDVAEAALQALNFPESEGKTFEVVEIDKKGSPDWSALFGSLGGLAK